jgi:3-methyladenine DNA glycosylase AlkC
MNDDRFSLKDHLFNKKSVTRFADLFYDNDPEFPKKSFIKNILKDFPTLELKQRISRMREELEGVLPKDYGKSLQIILNALPKELDPSKADNDFGDFILAPLSEFIRVHGCNKKYLNVSLDALHECTKRFSVEFSIRHFINTFPDETYAFLYKGALSENYHIRRLSSEGLRPKLPWAIGIDFNYKKSFEILDILFADKTRYVARSVANHVNDISKIDPDFVIEKLQQWEQSGKQNEKEMNFIINHSLRTLIKKAHPAAFELLGYSKNPNITIKNLDIKTPKITIGESLYFSFDILSQIDQKLIIDYVVHHQSASGKTMAKVFKLKKIDMKKGEKLSISKKQPFRIMTTKKLYPGIHRCELQINGKKFNSFQFYLGE